jgi:molybdate transport system substrate-binding protein
MDGRIARKRWARLAATALLAWAAVATLAGAGVATTARRAAAGSPADAPDELVVSAAASLTAAFQAVAAEFERAHSGVDVKLNFAGSPALVKQIEEGAPVDVFAAADEANMKRVVEAGKVAGAPRSFAGNRLAILVRKGNPERIASLADLARPGLVVALCAPLVPCGRYAREAFAKAGVAVPASSEELDVKAVVTKVSLGEADAGIVYETDVRAAAGSAQGVDIPEASNVVATYPIAVLAEAPHREAAEAFVAFVTGARGRAILEGFGFAAP